MVEGLPPVRYAKAGEVSIAYRALGQGPVDLVWVPGLHGNLEIEWDQPVYFAFLQRLASFSRLIGFDKRGMGLSDRSVGAPTLEQRMDDVRAVMDAVGSDRAALIGVSEGGPMSMLFAATYPERTVALILFGTYARARADVDYPFGAEESAAELYRILDDSWGTGETLRVIGPSVQHLQLAREVAGRIERASGSPATIRALLDTLVDIDVRPVLPMISAPTLVVHTTDDAVIPIGNGRWLAEHIAGARFVELPGDHAVYDFNRFADEVESFLTGRRHAITTDRILATVLFSDIVASTEHATRVGDRRWGAVLDQHDAVAKREIATYRGKFIKTTGDGVLATFDGPARAIACACDLRDELRPLGIEVRMGLHTGEVELRDHDLGGIAVHISARISGIAQPGQVLVSRTVTDLVAGSGIEFDECGEHRLKGVSGTWPLFSVVRT